MAQADTNHSTTALAKIASDLSDMETGMREAGNLAMALRMIASSDAIPKDAGGAIDTLADTLFEKIFTLEAERETICRMARGEETDEETAVQS